MKNGKKNPDPDRRKNALGKEITFVKRLGGGAKKYVDDRGNVTVAGRDEEGVGLLFQYYMDRANRR
ncbi:hypothetical protein KKB10_00255 [Patescibacteria group bacterium]|nr:hypothetical protein [Patescibacteria group bacterium]MBU1075487.1 hypothetical protein [Patescibacteria group bacterium]MBU1951592.1 hypothetical protein [Patescibacteria group bacterium]